MNPAEITGRTRTRTRPSWSPTVRTPERGTAENPAGLLASRFVIGTNVVSPSQFGDNGSIKIGSPTCQCTALSPTKVGRECGRTNSGRVGS